jgi:hypothetical protein
MDNFQNFDTYIYIPSSQTYRSFMFSYAREETVLSTLYQYSLAIIAWTELNVRSICELHV